jgi:hypothetical protein
MFMLKFVYFISFETEGLGSHFIKTNIFSLRLLEVKLLKRKYIYIYIYVCVCVCV